MAMKVDNKKVSAKAWGDVDKSALGKSLATAYANGDVTKAQIREVYAWVPDDAFGKDANGKPTFAYTKAWGPHHEVQGNTIVLNRSGLAGDAAAVAGARSEPSLDAKALASAKAHIRRHYKAIKEPLPAGLTEALMARKAERGQELTELVKGSLEYTADLIRDAFGAQFNPADVYPFPYHVVETFADHVIVGEWPGEELAPDEYYLVSYQKTDAGFSFAARDQWEIVELAYQSQTASPSSTKGESSPGNRLKRFIETIPAAVCFVESSEEEAENIDGPWRIAGFGTTADIVNENNRVYPTPVIVEALAELKTHLHESAGQGRASVTTGEPDHPSDKGNRRPLLLETVVNWDQVSFDGSHVNLDGVLLGTSKGKDIRAQMKGGVIPGISQRGYGDSKMVKRNGRMVEVVTKLHITGFDLTAPNEQSDLDAGVTMFESRPNQQEDKMDPEELKKFIGEHPELFKDIIKGNIEEAVKSMSADNLKALEESIRKAVGLGPDVDLGKALKEMAEAKRKLDEREKAEAVDKAISESTKDLPYGELNVAFVEAVKGAGLASPEAVSAFVESKRKEYDAIVAKAKLQSMGWQGVKILGPVLERETGVPEFARGAHEFSEALAVRGFEPRRDFRTPKTLNEEFTARVLARFDQIFKAQLMQESRRLEEAGELSTDLSLPYSVSRAIVAAVFPRLVAVSVFDFGVTDVTPFRLYFETSAKESGADGTATAEAVVMADVGTTWSETANKRLKPATVVVKQYKGTADGTVTMTEGTDYVVDYANGKVLALTGGSIAAGTILVDYGYLAIRKGENVAIERAKTTLSYKTLDAAADRLATLVTSEAITFSRSQIGWDATARTLANLVAEIRRKIDQDAFYAAITASLRTASNVGGTFSLATAGTALQNLVNYIGVSRVKIAKRYYDPTSVILSTSNSDVLANWAGFTQAGSRTDATLNAEGYVGRIKGLPCFQSTEFPDGYVLVVNRELVAHRVYQPLAIKGPFPTYSDGQLVAADQYYGEEYNVTDVPVANKGSHVIVTA